MIVRVHRALIVAIVTVVALIGGAVYLAGSSSAATTTATKHYVANVSGYYTQAAALGYNVLDVSSASNLANLPAGTQAMFWLGSGQKCPTPADASFKAAVDALAPNAAKVYGAYLSDEPETAGGICPDGTTMSANGPTYIKDRAAYVKSKLPNVKTFIVIDNQQTFQPYRPAVTGVDLVGIDPYPFNKNNAGSADPAASINLRVQWATTGGWSKSSIVPTFQTFGQEGTSSCSTDDKYYRFPTDAELNQLLTAWQAAGPFSELDYSYGWKNQSGTACPTLVDKPSAQQIMKTYFATAVTPTPTVTSSSPSSTTTTPAPTTTSSTTSAPPPTVTQTVTQTATVTQTVTQPPVTTTVTVTPAPRVSDLTCALQPTQPAPGDTITCAYR